VAKNDNELSMTMSQILQDDEEHRKSKLLIDYGPANEYEAETLGSKPIS